MQEGEGKPRAPSGWWPSQTMLTRLLMVTPMVLASTWFAKSYNLGDIPTFATESLMAAGGALILVIVLSVALHAVAWRLAPWGTDTYMVKHALIFMVTSTIGSWWYFSQLAAARSTPPGQYR